MKTSESITDLVKAISFLQSETKGAEKCGQNPHFKSRYVRFEDVWAAIRPHLSGCGLAIFQELVTKEASVSVTTLVTHVSGQWIEFGPLEIPFLKRDAQSIGSAASYAKRYSLSSAIGIAASEEDDDAATAVGQNEDKEAKPPLNEQIKRDQIKAIHSMLKEHRQGTHLHQTILEEYHLEALEKADSPTLGKIIMKLQGIK